MQKVILAIDQGTTSSRAIAFDHQLKPVAHARKEFVQHFPNNGWVEHDPEEIWNTTLAVCREVVATLPEGVQSIAAIGITNQRETTLVWDRVTGEPVYPAIVWQDRRTTPFCFELKNNDVQLESTIYKKTGLLLDPYFSATKIAWILDNVPGARARAERGELAFGTVDSFLLFRLTKGKRHATDVTNASRTLLFNIETLSWDEELLRFFNIPHAILPEVLDNCADFGEVDSEWFGAAVPVAGMAGDQHAASFGQACFHQGMVKSTYGTGCFLMANTGSEIFHSSNRLLSTVMFRVGGETTYAVEGSIFIAGAAVNWLRDKLCLIKEPCETESIAASLASNHGVYTVPAFTGLGAPYWRPDVRGAIVGMTRDTGRAEIVRSVLEAVAYQTKDLLRALASDGFTGVAGFRVDGGMVENNWLLQFLADIVDVVVERPTCIETTAMGAAAMAGLQVNYFDSLAALESLWQQDESFQSSMQIDERNELYQGWQDAVDQICN